VGVLPPLLLLVLSLSLTLVFALDVAREAGLEGGREGVRDVVLVPEAVLCFPGLLRPSEPHRRALSRPGPGLQHACGGCRRYWRDIGWRRRGDRL